MLKYTPCAILMSRGYNIEKGSGGQNVKIGFIHNSLVQRNRFLRGVSQLLLSTIVAFEKAYRRSGEVTLLYALEVRKTKYAVFTLKHELSNLIKSVFNMKCESKSIQTYIPFTNRVRGPYRKLRTKLFWGPCRKVRPVKLTNHSVRTNLEI